MTGTEEASGDKEAIQEGTTGTSTETPTTEQANAAVETKEVTTEEAPAKLVVEDDKFADADDEGVKQAAAEKNAEPEKKDDTITEQVPDKPTPVNAQDEAPAPTEQAVPQDVKVDTTQEPKQAEGSVPVPMETEAVAAAVKEDPAVPLAAAAAAAAAAAQPPQPEDDKSAPAIWEPSQFDVLSGRGASVNAHGGNKKFRSLCFTRKPEFEAGNHAAKRRIATEIVTSTYNNGQARFLKKKIDKGPWLEMTREQAILKACQVMRDYKRPDRMAIREMMAQTGQARKRSRQTESTPMPDMPIPTQPLEPIIENPFGVHDHDILCGRGAFVNGHIGNQRLRTLSQERKTAFDSGNYTEKRALAGEIVQIIKALNPPGRFLKRGAATPPKPAKEGEDWVLPPKGVDGEWEELNDEKSIHKACQVMRDIDRPDRKDRELRRAKKKQKILEANQGSAVADTVAGVAAVTALKAEVEATSGATEPPKEGATDAVAKTDEKKEGEPDVPKDATGTTETSAEKSAVAEAVAATEEALHKEDDGETKEKEETPKLAVVEI